MSLSPGTKIGPYVVVEPIGAGGMGEVFRAVDTRLKRDVAIKALPASAVDDAQKRGRFEREAQVLASLNHPSVAQVFGVELEGDTPFIVMEFVSGETLADRLRKGAIALDEALPIATQICDGLEAAHDRNIVHRDLKPANIKVRPDGTIKILDFGIARVLATDTAVDNTNSPTHLGGTDAGIILGTAAYMSPEQARAKSVDKRTDIWAFGCILFEMLSGKPVFSGESTTDILADIVKKDPDWPALPASLPDRLVELIARCLQKNVKDRLRDIGDARYELTFVNSRESTAPSASPLSRLAWFAAGAIVAAIAVGLLTMRRENAAAPRPINTSIVMPPGMSLTLGRGSSVALSPDGRTIVFAARINKVSQLYLRQLDRFESQPLAGTEDAVNPFFSPDGRWVGFLAGEKLKKVSLDGGTPVAIADTLNLRGNVWGANDEIFVTPSNSAGVSSLPARGGGKLGAFTKLREGELSHRWPRQMPDGKTLLFAIWNDVGWEASRIAAVRTAGGEPIPIVEVGGGYPAYIRDEGQRGFLVYARSEGLLAARFDETTLAMSGQPVPVIDGVNTNLSGGAHFDLSPSGTLAYIPGGFGESARELTWVSREGTAEPPFAIAGLTRTFKLSPDGTRLVRNSQGTSSDVSVEDLAAKRTIPTATTNTGSFNGAFSGDGKTVFYARGIGASSVFSRAADGTGPEQQLTKGTQQQWPGGTTADGRWLSYVETDKIATQDIWLLPMPAGSGPAKPIVNTRAIETFPQFSPDSKWMAYQSNETGRFEIYVRSIPDGQQVIRISTDSGVNPMWSASGSELFYRSLTGKMMMAVDVKLGSGFSAGRPHALFEAQTYENVYAVAPDGKRFLMMPLIGAEQNANQINVIVNFLTQLRERVR